MDLLVLGLSYLLDLVVVDVELLAVEDSLVEGSLGSGGLLGGLVADEGVDSLVLLGE